MGEGDITPEVSKKVTTEQKVNTDKTKEPHPDAGKINEFKDKETAQAQDDEIKEEKVRGKIADITGTSDKKSTESKSEAVDGNESEPFDNHRIFAPKSELNPKGEFIFTKDSRDSGGNKWNQMLENGMKSNNKRDSNELMKDLMSQLDKYVPKELRGQVPYFMLRVRENGNLYSDPLYQLTLKDKILGKFTKYDINNKDVKSADKDVVKKLQDHYTNSKAAEQKSPSNTPK